MKKLSYFCLTFLVASMLAIPAAAQAKKGTRNNNGTNERHGQAQAENHKPSKGTKSKGQKTREGWEKKSQHGGRK